MDYFAGANTRNGFVSLFPDIIGRSKRVYIIKGTPGCGKSTFMKRVAFLADKKGYETDRIFCSGDPDSLDGVYIRGIGVLMIDGTSPHTADAVYPFARDSLIDLGAFINGDKLAGSKEEIIRLCDSKALCYKRAYSLLSARGDIRDALLHSAVSRTDPAVLARYTRRLSKKLFSADGGRQVLIAKAFSPSGVVTLPSFTHVGTLLRLSRRGGAGTVMLLSLCRAADEARAQYCFIPDPTDISLPAALYFPGSDMLVSASADAPCTAADTEKNVCAERIFVRDSAPSAGERLLTKLSASLAAEALRALSQAKDIHLRLEAVYSSAVDFDSLGDFTESFVHGLFAE